MSELSNLFRYRLNTAKHTSASIAKLAKISELRIIGFIDGSELPEPDEIKSLAEALGVQEKDLSVATKDTAKGIKLFTSNESRKTRRLICRSPDNRAIPYYEYQDIVTTNITPNARGEILDILCVDVNDVVQNHGHLQDALTFVTKGEIQGYWTNGDGQTETRILKEGHSYFLRGFVPHTYRSTSTSSMGQIISFTFTQNLTGGAQSELSWLSLDRAKENLMSVNPYGNLLICHLNNSMLTIDQLSASTKLKVSRVESFIYGDSVPSSSELLLIAKSLEISVCDLIPTIADSDYGIKHLTAIESNKTKRRLRDRQGNLVYEVNDLARTSEASMFRSHRVRILQEKLGDAKYDLFSTEHTIIFIYKNSGTILWMHEDSHHSMSIEEYDSIYIEPFIKYTFLSDNACEVLRFQYPSKMCGDARKEMFHKGVSGIERIVKDSKEWAPDQTSKSNED